MSFSKGLSDQLHGYEDVAKDREYILHRQSSGGTNQMSDRTESPNNGAGF